MLQTVEALIDANGRVHLLENVKLGKNRRALVTILNDEEDNLKDERSIVGTIEILDDNLDDGSLAIAKMFDDSLNNSAKDLKD